MPTVTLSDICRMPKYRNQKWEDVIRGDPAYVGWLIRNLDNFTLDNAAYEVYKKACDVFGVEP
jgi:hypothetical protein